MMRARGVALLTAALALGCAGASAGGLPSTQQFTRHVNATPASLVSAALATFSRYGIPVASSDETSGRVRSVPMSLRGNWGPVPLEERVSCPGAASDTLPGRVTFEVQVKPVRYGSDVTLNAQRQGDSRCVIRSSFVTKLLDEIAGAQPR
ncbi:MAG TPA: hypothetical protein VFK09_05225 [Gemmatimonadales bacterium]|jgi:hypothetical protein|nr:hypothetical protein [Gemmatimonadales bacterium]